MYNFDIVREFNWNGFHLNICINLSSGVRSKPILVPNNFFAHTRHTSIFASFMGGTAINNKNIFQIIISKETEQKYFDMHTIENPIKWHMHSLFISHTTSTWKHSHILKSQHLITYYYFIRKRENLFSNDGNFHHHFH